MRTHINAQTELFTIQDSADTVYFLESGELLVCCSLRHQRRTGAARARAAVLLLEPGDLFVFDCDRVHVADCYATVDSKVLCINRSRLENIASSNSFLRRALRQMHARELEFILSRPPWRDGPSSTANERRGERRSVIAAHPVARGAATGEASSLGGLTRCFPDFHLNDHIIMRRPMANASPREGGTGGITHRFSMECEAGEAAGQVYGPEELGVITSAFDAAWEEISGQYGDDSHRIYASRVKLAKAVLSAARNHNGDPDAIRRSALLLFRFNLVH